MIWPSIDRYAAWLQSWENTGYHDGMCKRGAGVDCLRFVCATLDWLHGFDSDKLPPIPNFPPQTSMHRPDLAWSVVGSLEARYPCYRLKLRNRMPIEPLRPADVLIVKNAVNPAHVMIAGVQLNVLWHSMNNKGADRNGGVARSSLGCAQTCGILRIWRMDGAAVWK